MRSVLVIVLILKLGDCASLNVSENEQQAQYGIKPKFNISEHQLSNSKILLVQDKSNFHKKRCDLCKETKRCKIQGKCEICKRFCKLAEPLTPLTSTEAPVLGNRQEYLEANDALTTKPINSEVDSSEKNSRYYTIGTFGPGPKQSLIARLLNISKKNKLDKLVVLAKAKGKDLDDNAERPIIIDTANVFKVDGNSKEVDANIYPVDPAKVKATDWDLTSQIDRELDMAIQQKKKLLGTNRLTKKEVDKVVDHALSLFNRKALSPPPELEQNMIALESRHNYIEAPHLTTKRSIIASKDTVNKNKSNDIVGAQEPPEAKSKSQDDLMPQESVNSATNNSKPETEKQKHAKDISIKKASHILNDKPSKNKIAASKGVSLGHSGTRHSQSGNHKDNHYIAEDNCNEDEKLGIEINEDEYDSGEELVEYEPRPPRYHEENYQPSNSEDNSLLRNVHPVISIPVDSKPALESASQHIENTQPFKNSALSRPSIFRKSIQSRNDAPTAIHKKSISNKSIHDVVDNTYEPDQTSPATAFNSENPEEETDATSETFIGTTTAMEPDKISFSTIEVDPIVGSKFGGSSESKKNFTSEAKPTQEDKLTSENQTAATNKIDEKGENLEVAESKVNAMNTSIFTLILKNLEKKVENIADLVKKTCGKGPESEEEEEEDINLGQRNPIAAKNEESVPMETNGKNKIHLGQPTESSGHVANILENRLKVPEMPKNDTTNFEPITTGSQIRNGEAIPPEKRQDLLNIDGVVDELQKGHKVLLDKALNVVDLLEEGLKHPVKGSDNLLSNSRNNNDGQMPTSSNQNILSETNNSGSSNEDLNPHTRAMTDIKKEDPTVGCSEESSEEYVGNTNSEKLQKTKDAPGSQVQVRSGVTPEMPVTTNKSNVQDILGYSGEDSDEYTDKNQQIEPNESRKHPQSLKSSQKSSAEKHMKPNVVTPRALKIDKKLESNPRQFPQKSKLIAHPQLQTLRPKADAAKQDKTIHIFENPELKKPSEDNKENEDEKVGCSEEDSDEYVGKSMKEDNATKDTISSTPKEEDEDVDLRINDKPTQQKIPLEYTGKEQKLPASKQANKLSPPPLFEQRFADQHDSGNTPDSGNNGFHLHRPKNLPNWPKLPELVDDTELGDSIAQETGTAAPTQNPFSIFGKVVPQLNNTEISFHHIPSNKVYFVGTGMQLPLNMRKHADGSYQLSVDVEKLCNTCTENFCKKNSENQISLKEDEEKGALNSANAILGVKPPSSLKLEDNQEKAKKIQDYLRDIDQRKYMTDESHSPSADQDKQPTQQTPQRIEILTLEEPILRSRRYPDQLKHHDSDNHNSRHLLTERRARKIVSGKSSNIVNLTQHGAQPKSELKQESPHQLFDLGYNKQQQHSALSKRSVSYQTSPLKPNHRFAKSLNFNNMNREEQFSRGTGKLFRSSQNSMDSGVDASLEKNDRNMKNYLDHRQKLENHYRNRNRFDLKHPHLEGDVARQRVKLLNNVLTWMKSIAVKDPHT